MELSSVVEQAPKWGVFLFYFCHQFPQGGYYWAACKGNTQLINEKQFLFKSKKTKWQTEIPEDFACPIPPVNGANFVGREWVISGHLANRFGSELGTSTKLMHGVIDLTSTPNDYLNTAFDDDVSLCKSCRKNALPRSAQERL